MLEKIGLPPKPSLRGNNWVADSSHCQGCSSQFTFINRKHHCRRCGGLFCNSCTNQRMVLRGQGDSPVRICEPCKKLEEAARFELRYGHKNRVSRGGSKISSRSDHEVLSGHESTFDSMQRSTSSASSSNIQDGTTQNDAGEIQRSLSVDVHNNASIDMGSTTPDELRQQAVEEKKKHKILKAEGKAEEALRAFKRGKELERQAAALELQLRKTRKQALSSISMNETQKIKNEQNNPGESSRRIRESPQISRDKDDLGAELRELGWSDLDLRNVDKKPANMSLEGELITLLKEVPQKTNTEIGTHSINKSEVLAHKKRALTFKREGKLAEAKEELKRAKVLEKKIEEQEFLIDAEDSDDEFSSLIRSLDIDKQDVMSIGNLQDSNFSFDHLSAIDDGLGDGNFEVTDDDMYDPDITAALESMGWTEDNNHPDEIVDREAVLSEIQSLKREAVIKKRSGDTAEAMILLKKAKALERDLDSNDSQANNLPAQNTEPKLAPKSKLTIQKELLALKKRALALRREGKLDEADEELKKGKILEQQLEEMDTGSKVKATPVTVNKHVDHFAADVGNEEGDVTDQDMNDPSYISLLKNLGWNDESTENVPTENESTRVQTSDSSCAQVHHVVQVGLPRRSKGEIQRELLGLKRKSLALRRQGEAEEAEEVLKMAKNLEAQLAEMEAPKQDVLVQDNIPSASENNSTDNLRRKDEVTHEKTDETSNLAEVMVPQNNLKQEILAHKRKAVTLKREGKLAEAKEELRQAKLLEKSVENDSSPQPSTSSSDNVSSSKTEPIGQKEKSPSSGLKMSSRDRFKLQQESLSHKRQALKLRREGRMAEAEAEFELAKALESQLEEMNGQDSTKAEHADDVGVEDFLDPQLLSALKAIGLEDATASSSQGPVVRSEPIKSAVAVAAAAKVEKNNNEERTQLEEEIRAEKMKALNLKRSGRQAEALGALRRAKLLEKKLISLTS
ncbi:hypothetical protein LguiA_015085 [Lonicera macranthoides]